jgi:hypothetical protein
MDSHFFAQFMICTSMYKFGDAMWLASGDKSNGKGYMKKNW